LLQIFGYIQLDWIESILRLEKALSIVVFWVGIVLKRIPGFVKKYPIIVFFSVAVLLGLVLADMKSISLNREQFIITMYILGVFIFISSLKSIDTLNTLIFYSGSSVTNKGIVNLIFIMKSIFNCVPYILFFIFVLLKIIILKFENNNLMIFFLLKMMALFLFSSFLIINAMCHIKGKILMQNKKKRRNTRYINPTIKSTIYDLSASHFLHETVAVNVLLIVVLNKMTLSVNNDIQSYLMFMALLISVGFLSFIDVPFGVNWRFYSFISFDIKYHIKRSGVSLLSIYCLYMIIYFILNAKLKNDFLFLHIIGFLCMLILSVGLTFVSGNIFFKAIFGLFVSGLMIIYCQFNWYTLLFLLPAFFVNIKAKNDFYLWGML
jgi:hypothetical protein